ncbi:MAG: glycoside hydrolase family 3 N-terminal domain-containing protein [Gemmatimonadales bacterium]
MTRRTLGLACALLAAPAVGGAQVVGAPYRDAAAPVEARVADLLGRMTPAEKFWQLFMLPGDRDDPSHDYRAGVFGLQVVATDSTADAAAAHAARLNAIQHYFVDSTRLGIPFLPFDEALHGLMRPGATAFPQAIALAATWDTALVGRVAGAISRETRSRGIRQVLSPVVNLSRDARWGRTEESYGEDPVLAAALGVAFVSPFEREGVVTTPKHFVANVGDGGRDSWPIEASERQLREVWFPPFEAAIHRGGARSVMSAYNSVDGLPASQNGYLLTEVLRDRWGFDGIVISDAAATAGATVLHRTEASVATSARRALAAGLDVVFQSSWEQHRPWLRAFTDGSMPDALIDRAVARVLRTKFRLGLFEQPYADPDSATAWNGRAEHLALAREAAAAGMVLLTNPRGILPLVEAPLRIAVIGPDAATPRLGGYSGPGVAPVSFLDAWRGHLPTGTVTFTEGPGRENQAWPTVPASALRTTRDGRVVPGLSGSYFASPEISGQPTATRADPKVDFHWTFVPPAPGLPIDWYAVRWVGEVVVPADGPRRLAVEGDDGFRLWIDDVLVLDRWAQVSNGLHPVGTALPAGTVHKVRLEFRETTGNGRIRLAWQGDEPAAQERAIAEAVEAARGSDLAIVVAGLEEGEFRDRASLALPGRQPELIRRVAATGTPVIVVVVGGAPFTLDEWGDDVAAVLMAWYPGEQGGAALAEVLRGDLEPRGRLPITFPRDEGQLPLFYGHKPTGRGDDYLDLSGRPAFPFGFGLGYTTWEYGELTLPVDTVGPGDSVRVAVTITNTGARTGSEVVQLYLRDELASVAQPVLRLLRFAKVTLAPGQSREVTWMLGPDDLALLDADLQRVVEPGAFRLTVGPSSREARGRAILTVVGDTLRLP